MPTLSGTIAASWSRRLTIILVAIGVLSLFPIYFAAVTGLKNGIQLQENPFNIAIAHPFGIFYAQAWEYLKNDLLRTA